MLYVKTVHVLGSYFLLLTTFKENLRLFFYERAWDVFLLSAFSFLLSPLPQAVGLLFPYSRSSEDSF